ncbi:hypothetical protein [Streptomyces solaniscabiei]|uniref:hypothetical protein n=1 Tax=Streptomyces solaniscabiei TaxID=2683255 RepID=UPI001CE356D3|nr:hypothetical protein [Streptomyces solaniscabiei]
MSETPNELPVPVGTSTPDTGSSGPVDADTTEHLTADPHPATTPGRRSHRRVAVVTGTLLLGAAVAGAVGYTAVAVVDADRDPGAPSWVRPGSTAGHPATAAEPNGLAWTLVPYRPDNWSRGPDLGEFGSDTTLSGKRATALLKQSVAGLPRTQRKSLEKEIDRRPVQEMAMRSYAFTGGEGANRVAGAATMTLVLTRMEDQAAARATATGRNAFMDALDVFRDGPEIEGYKDAACFRPPIGSDGELDSMYCSAYVGDIAVTATAEGLQPFDAEGVAALLKDQLDRIVEPGESV